MSVILVILTFLSLSVPTVIASIRTSSSMTSRKTSSSMTSRKTSASVTSSLYDIVTDLSSVPSCVRETFTVYVGAQCSLSCEKGPWCQDFIICNTTSSTATCHTLSDDRTCVNTNFDANTCRRFSKRNAWGDREESSERFDTTSDLTKTTWTSEASGSVPSTCNPIPESLEFTDCAEAWGYTGSCLQTVTIRLQNQHETFKVLCYKGETVIQKRSTSKCDSAFFNRSWSDYASGFGDRHSCFWIGNEKIRAITNQMDYTLKLQVSNGWSGWPQTAMFLPQFKIDHASNQYRLDFNTYAFYLTNGVGLHVWGGCLNMKGANFYTYDNNHGTNSSCAVVGGGWWYGDVCDCGNLNNLQAPRWPNEPGQITSYTSSYMTLIPAFPL